jgi:cell fate (sporulation/competence/biofilm development) regulator YmcA (YheA/YmcA/DUF963 family)
MDQLASYGEHSKDLLSNLLEAYRTVPDQRFIQYIETQINAYDEEESLHLCKLMKLAQKKYRVLVNEKKWAAPTQADEKIAVLEAQLAKYKESNHCSYKKNNNRSKKYKDSTSVSKDNSSKPKWMTKAPSAADKNKPKTHNNTEYWCCPTHKAWGQHKASECRKKKKQDSTDTTSNNIQTSGTSGNTSNTSNTTTANDKSTGVNSIKRHIHHPW